MLKLIQNELMKIFRRPGTYIMIALLLIGVMITGGVMKYLDSTEKKAANDQWKQGVMAEKEAQKEQLKGLEGDRSFFAKAQTKMLNRQIAINDYRLKNNIPPNESNVWAFVSDSSSMISLVAMFMIVTAGGIVASEFSWGTIKLLLIRPIKREKILLSKYLTVLLFGGIMLVILYVFSAIVGAILFGMPETAIPHLTYEDGKVMEQSMAVHLMKSYGLNSIGMLMIATMAFMISAVFRNQALAIGISMFLMFTGDTATQLLSTKFNWAKYSLFANTNLTQYTEGIPLVEGMTLSFSLMILLVYFVLFQFIAFFIFKKRDVAA